MLVLAGCTLSTGPEVGKTAPSFALPSTTGTYVGTTGSGRNILLLDFMGSRCVSCVHQMPALQDLDQRYHDSSFVLLSVDNSVAAPSISGRYMQDLKDFQARFHANWTFVQDQQNASVGLTYQIVSLPTLFLVMADGEIAMKHTGIASFECLDSAVAAALADPDGSPRPHC